MERGTERQGRMKLKRASKATLARIAAHVAAEGCKAPRPALLAMLAAGVEITTPLPEGCQKISPEAREMIAEAAGCDSITLPLERDRDKGGRTSAENLRIYIQRYILPAWPEAETFWQGVILTYRPNGEVVLWGK